MQLKDDLSRYLSRTIVNPSLETAAVLVPIIETDPPTILFMKRSAHLALHRGEISFPGGRYETQDANILETLFREVYEEIGVTREKIEIVGKIDDIVTITGYIVQPYVGLIAPGTEYKISPQEVERVFSVPLPLLRQPEIFQTKALRLFGQIDYPIYYYHISAVAPGEVIWGATGKILYNLLKLIAEGA